MDIMQKMDACIAFLHSRTNIRPKVGIVLGSGLGNLVNQIEVEARIPYNDVPHFPVSTVEGHKGEMIFGRIGQIEVVAMAGRFHFYEGYDAQTVVFPIRVMKFLGVETLLLSNAAGGMHPDFQVGDLMIINDHISMFIQNPLIGHNIAAFGPRFPDMSEPYSKELIQKAKAVAASLAIPVHEGVYVGVTGPTFETRAEYRMLHRLGADVVGMSTVQEVIVANHMGMKVFAVSIVTDLGIREEENTITHEEVLEAANAAEPKLTAIIKGLLAQIY